MKQILEFKLNGIPVEILSEPHNTLLEVLRDKLKVMSPKCGCNEGTCGACTVDVDGKAFKSCITLALTVKNKNVTTVEGLNRNGHLHAVQKAFYDHGAPQCGFCTPGMVMAAVTFLNKKPNPTLSEVKYALSGNLCRCTGYVKYIEAVMAVAKGEYCEFEGGADNV